jgi:predicted nucleic acid-binding protein
LSTIVLDTNVVSYLMGGHSLSQSYRPHLEGRTLAISFMTVGELYEGAYRRGWGEGKLAKLKQTIRSHVVIPFSFGLCREWGAIRYERRQQQPIAVDDAWIAATARAHGCPLVTHNPNDFRGIDGLDVLTEYDPSRAKEAPQ